MKKSIWAIVILIAVILVAGIVVRQRILLPRQEISPGGKTNITENKIVHYESKELGIQFDYPDSYAYPDNRFHADVVGDTAYLNLGEQTTNTSYWIRSFFKDSTQTLEKAIRVGLLAKYPKCLLTTSETSASLMGPGQVDDLMSDRAYGDLTKCPPDMAGPAGFLYFSYDPRYPDHYIFIRTSQDAIKLPDGRSWTNTIQIVPRTAEVTMWKTYSNANMGFSFSYPASWPVPTITQLRTTAVTNFGNNFSVTTGVQYDQPEQRNFTFSEVTEGYKNTPGLQNVHIDDNLISVDGHLASKITYDDTSTKKNYTVVYINLSQQVQEEFIELLSGDSVDTVTFDKILASFKFTKPYR